ncbi:MAG: DUF1292 domain-containing protein [Bacilli bacterium]|jgi:uncharacterized protein YrzB (UPF0473 family)|nr:DUF1292 domain-containing protein [Bacilli bacterium]
MNKTITITNDQGQKVVADIVSIINISSLDTEYVIYTFNKKDESGNIKDYISKIKQEDGKYILEQIEDPEEWNKVKEMLLNSVKVA